MVAELVPQSMLADAVAIIGVSLPQLIVTLAVGGITSGPQSARDGFWKKRSKVKNKRKNNLSFKEDIYIYIIGGFK